MARAAADGLRRDGPRGRALGVRRIRGGDHLRDRRRARRVRFGAVARIKKGAAEMAGGKDMATSVQVGLANLREGKPLKKKAR